VTQFTDSETQRLLRDTARSFLADRFPVERLYRFEAGDEQLTDADLTAIAELGWFGLVLPEASGGGGASLLDAAAVIEEAGYACAPLPIATATIAGALLNGTSTAADLAADLASGSRLVTVTGRSGRGEPNVSVRVGRIDGELRQVPFASMCTFVLTPITADGEPAFAALPLDVARIEPLALLDRRTDANVRFDGADGAQAVVLATGEDAVRLREKAEALSTAFTLIDQSGLMRRLLEMTATHISTRVQFGQAIAKFQAARHRAAELLMQVETTRWAAYHALWQYETSGDASEIWLTKHWAVRAADRAFQISHLLHGGVGVGTDHPLHLYTQGIAASAVRGGTMPETVSRITEGAGIATGAGR
jgi:alkylation response protein AidB-like acyl-CoA dehydrogenase